MILHYRDMHGYQKAIARLIMQNPYVGIVLPMGGGKTVSTLTAIEDLLYWKEIRRVLIVAPLRVAEEVWIDEVRKWSHLNHLSVSIITGSPAGRRFAIKRTADIYCINRENLVWLWNEMAGQRWKWDMIIIDESTMLKDGSKMTKPRKVDGEVVKKPTISRFGVLAKARKYCRRVVELTGTVAPEGIIGLWGMAYILDQGERLGTSKSAFESRWFESDYMGYKKTPRLGAREEIIDRVKDIIIAPDVSEHIKKHPVTHNIIPVHLSPEEMKRYRKFERTLFAEEYDVAADTAGILTNKLLQFANGSMYNEDGEDVFVHDHKLHALEDIVEEMQGENLMVAYSYQFDLRRIKKRFPKAVILNESKNAYRDWNNGKIRMLLCHPASAGHGLNMQFGGHHLIHYGLQWSLELYLQINARLPRSGQKEMVMIHHILCKDTMDYTVYKKMQTNGAEQDEITRAVLRTLEMDYA